MTDREMLEMAAKAAGIRGVWSDEHSVFLSIKGDMIGDFWHPLTDDGDALRLAVKLNLSADFFDDEIRVGYTPNNNECDQVSEPSNPDPYAATRRAIVRAAAEIGRSKA